MSFEKEQDFFMGLALNSARLAGLRGEVPVGAVIVQGSKVLSQSGNSRERNKNPLGHAEMLCIRAASHKLRSWRLDNCKLYASLEPCLMCMGAVIQARIPHLIYGCPDPKGGFSSFYGINKRGAALSKIKIESGLRARESALLLQRFFKNLRQKACKKPSPRHPPFLEA